MRKPTLNVRRLARPISSYHETFFKGWERKIIDAEGVTYALRLSPCCVDRVEDLPDYVLKGIEAVGYRPVVLRSSLAWGFFTMVGLVPKAGARAIIRPLTYRVKVKAWAFIMKHDALLCLILVALVWATTCLLRWAWGAVS